MAGKNKKKTVMKSRRKGKSKKPMSHIGSALFPRAMFAAVPRSPEPPSEPPEERPPSALSTALLNASLVGRVIGTPPDSGTLRSTGEGASTWPMAHHHQDGMNASMENSMARSSMYDYEDSGEEDQEDYDEAGYTTIPLAKADRQKRGTISNRAKLATPVDSQSDSVLGSEDEDEDDGKQDFHPQQDTPPRGSSPGLRRPSPQQRLYHTLEKEQEEEEAEPRVVAGRRDPSPSEGKAKRSKGRQRKDGMTSTGADHVEALYAKAKKHNKQPVQRRETDLSESSSLTMVTSPQEDDFSDLITPPPPWKRKGKKKDKTKGSGVSPDRLTEEDVRSETSHPLGPEDTTDAALIHEPIIERIEASSVSAMQQSQAPVPAPRSTSRQSQDESEAYSHIQRQPLGHAAAQEEEYLRRTNSRLERELEMVQREREQLLESLRTLSPPPHQPRRGAREVEGDSEQLRTGIQRLASINDDMQRQLDEMHQHCDKLRLENQAIKEVNDRLHSENSKLRSLSESIKDEDHSQQVLLRQQAEEVVAENEQLKMVIHKLNIQLSRYQAKHSPPQKGDPPGLPSRGRTPRWLTDTKYLSPLILAYEDALKEKDEMMRLTQEDLNRLRKSAEEVIHENQRLHLKLEQVGQPTSVTPGEWHRIQEHARLVLEENQVVLSQLDILQRKQKDTQRAHSLEVSKLSKRLAMEESEKGDLEAQLKDLKHRYSTLKQQHDRSVVEAESQMPIQEHMSTMAEYKRGLDEEQRHHQAEMESVLSKLSSVQGEKKTLALRLADGEAERSQMQGEMKALTRVQKKLQHKIALLQKELEHNENKLAVANQHLNNVLEIAEQTAAERDALTKVARSQEQEKKKAVNKMMEGNVAIGRLEEKLKSYRQKADLKLGNLSSRIQAQDSSHVSQLREYEREMAHLKTLLQQKQDELDNLGSDKRKVEEQLETVWQTATADNRRLKAKLQKSLREPHSRNGTLNGGAFEYESDNRGLISSESD